MKKNISFEEALSSLEDIVRKLESAEISLDESLSEFEEAVKLVKFCNEKLDKAERKVRMLVEKDDGTVDDVPFEVTQDET